ncbi:MAG TPA: efflux RND transporter periplasmic adaptor subunit [Rhizobacter sp.]|nr:efflux RND transporter periplasmic adaptor subunit [Rhizobacter sp.]
MKKKWTAAVAGVLLTAVAAVTFPMLLGPAGKEVEVEVVSERVIMPSILASGTLIYEGQVTLVSEIVGRVEAVLVKEGDVVTKGQLLLRLDAESSQAEIAQLLASQRQSELNMERQRVNRDSMSIRVRRYKVLREQGLIEATKYDELVTQKNIAEVELRTSREGVKQVEAQVKQSQQRLAKTEIRAPIDGKVTSVTIKAGETAVPSAVSIAGSNLMVISDTKSMYAEINVDETDIARIAIGQQAKIVPAAFPDKSLHGKVEQVAVTPRQNPGQARNYPVKIRLDPNDVAFHPGMSCRAEIATAKSDGANHLGVPVQAVEYEDAVRMTDKTKASVFVVQQGEAVRREVETGIADDQYIEVLSGLKRDETVIVGPPRTLRFLQDGEPVKPKIATPALAASAASNPL